MLLDVKLLESISSGGKQPILHLYDWDGPSATYGYFIDPYAFLNGRAVKETGLQLARRPTGGGIVFHVSDFAFTILVPSGHEAYSVNTMDNYAFVNNIVIGIVKQFAGGGSPSLLPTDGVAISKHAVHFCMAKPTKYDVILDGRKIGGAAQRRTKNGFLHQGTISLAMPDEGLLQQILLPGTGVLEAMQANTGSLLKGKPDLQQIRSARNRLREVFSQCLAG